MSRARDIANLVDANGDIKSGALDNVAAFPTGWSSAEIAPDADNAIMVCRMLLYYPEPLQPQQL